MPGEPVVLVNGPGGHIRSFVDALARFPAEPQWAVVDDAWWEPDWADLALYGFYCLEASVVAAALHLGLPPTKRSHPAKVEQARQLAAAYGLPDIDDLLVELNDRRKFEAYGDIELPEDEDRDARIGEDALAERLGEALARRSLLS